MFQSLKIDSKKEEQINTLMQNILDDFTQEFHRAHTVSIIQQVQTEEISSHHEQRFLLEPAPVSKEPIKRGFISKVIIYVLCFKSTIITFESTNG
jgi:hypothetical protein